MRHVTAKDRSTTRRSAKYRFVMALSASLFPFSGFSYAQDGVRELRNPSEMDKVPPVRAVGIRLSPAAPIRIGIAVAASRTDMAPVRATERPPTPKPIITETVPLGQVLPSTVAAINDPVLPASSVPLPPLTLPELPHPELTSPAIASSEPTSPELTSPELTRPELTRPEIPMLQTARKPERITPKSRVAVMDPGNSPVQVPLIKPQSPIELAQELAQERDEIRTASAPAETNEETRVERLLATEPPPVIEPVPEVKSEPISIALAPAMQLTPQLPLPPEPSAIELEQAIRVELDAQSTREVSIDFPIQSVHVRDEKICRVMASDGRIYLIGLTLGESLVEVKPLASHPSRFLRVKVVSPWQRSGSAADLDQLVHAIQPLSSSGSLSVRAQEDGSVVVQGKVENRETAKRIMELTRKLILVPVVDKLEIR
ncbi:MAG: hypothetical protein ACK6A7_12095 [Planctomycetota bacterium]